MARKARQWTSPSVAPVLSGASLYTVGAKAVFINAAVGTFFLSLVGVLGILHATKLGSSGGSTTS